MTIDFNTDIMLQLANDRRDSTIISNAERTSAVANAEASQESDNDTSSSNENENTGTETTNEPFFTESTFTFTSTVNENNLNSSIGGGSNFFETLGASTGNVNQAS